MLDKLRSRLVHFGPSLMSVPVKLTPFALKRQVLEQVLSWPMGSWSFSTVAG